MKRKKVLSTAVAGALVAAQMVMPVAATDQGSVDIDVTTQTAVIRVEVPTSLVVAVDQFEMKDDGSQIYSGDFTIQNKSEIPVKMSVKSTVTLDQTNPIGLVAKKDDAENSTAQDGEAWLAAAAMIDAKVYASGGTSSDKKLGDLTETSENVATFATDSNGASTVEQIFYLAADTSSSVTYTDITIADADDLAEAKKIAYAQFYELTEITSSAPTNNTELQAAVDNDDIAVIVSGSPNTVTVWKKGSTVTGTFPTSPKIYTIASSKTDVAGMTSAPASATVYIYGEAAAPTTGGNAGFRYIGKLSEKEVWSDEDITDIKIEYDIKGVTSTRYTEVKDDCTYGLYGGAASSVQEVAGVNVTNGSGSATYATGADVANRLKSGAVQFVLDASTATTVKSGSVSVTKIEIDGTEYTPTASANGSAHANADGKVYSVTGFTASTVSTIKVYYGTDLVVKYTF